MSNKGFAQLYIVVAVIILLVIAGVAYFAGTTRTNSNTAQASTTPNYTGDAAAVASQAHAKCIQNGGFVTTSYRGSWGFYNVCNFADDQGCELYALYEGQCPVGGVKTVGYSTSPQVFCALRGGTPQGSENGECKLPNGTVCTTLSVYEGSCVNP